MKEMSTSNHFSNSSCSERDLVLCTPDDKKDDGRKSNSGRTSPIHSNQGTLRSNRKKLIQEKKAKKIRIFRNGDKFFKGQLYVLTAERLRTFDALLEDLTRVLSDKVNLPNGVRHIFSFDGKDRIISLDQFIEGDSYICSSVDHYVKLDYLKKEKPQWSLTKKLESSQSLRWEPNSSIRENREFIKPKLVTIIRNGLKPRKAVRILLNKKTAHSLDQVLNDITNAIKLDSGAVRKIFTLSGKQVASLADFFCEEDIFVAYGPEKYSHDDFDLDSEEYKYLMNGMKSSGASGSTKHNRRSGLFSLHSPISRRRISSPYTLNNISPCSSRDSLSASPSILHSANHSKYDNQNGNGVPIPQIPNEVTMKYDVGRVIGDGNFAIVYTCSHRDTGKEYALKAIDKNKCKGKSQLIESEVAILRRVKHVNIVQLIEEFDFEIDLYLVMELVKGGDLFDAIASTNKYSEKEASSMIYDLCSALCYLHSLNIVHRDVKPENLFVVDRDDGSQSLKLGDFGLAVEVNGPLFIVCGTPTYVAPEILAESTGYGLLVDVWAAGVITYILLCGFPPFASQTNDQAELFDQILAGKYEFTQPFWDDVSDEAKELIVMMLQVNPEDRFSAADVLDHPWVSPNVSNDNKKAKDISREIALHFDPQLKVFDRNRASLLVTQS